MLRWSKHTLSLNNCAYYFIACRKENEYEGGDATYEPQRHQCYINTFRCDKLLISQMERNSEKSIGQKCGGGGGGSLTVGRNKEKRGEGEEKKGIISLSLCLAPVLLFFAIQRRWLVA